MNTPRRVVFFGTPQFAVPSLDALLASHHSVVGVVTQPDRPRGRGQKTSDAPVKASALAHGVPVLQPPRLKDPEFMAALAALNADLGVVAAYGKILSQAVLDTPPLGMVNVHASLLPRHRGAAPIHRAVIAGDAETGITIMRVVQALDAGPMIAAVKRRIGPNETSAELEADLASLGAQLLVDTLDRIGSLPEVAQDDALATYAHRLTKEDGVIDWTRSAAEIHNQVRGLHPWPHAHTFLDGQRLILLRTTRELDGVDAHAARAPGGITTTKDALLVATGSGVLRILELQAEGKRPMTARDFLAGRTVADGARFTSGP
jgi:methionyl-tRNA formyltransferase